MRHLKTGRKFGRTSAHRKALFRNMVTALIDRERVRTTLAKAKELRGKVEKTISLGKKGTLHARRHALKLVADKDSLKKIFGPLAERYANRPGGYTRVIKLGHRLGDDAPMAFIELVDREGESPVKPPPVKGKKKIEETSKKKAAGEKITKPKKDKLHKWFEENNYIFVQHDDNDDLFIRPDFLEKVEERFGKNYCNELT